MKRPALLLVAPLALAAALALAGCGGASTTTPAAAEKSKAPAATKVESPSSSPTPSITPVAPSPSPALGPFGASGDGSSWTMDPAFLAACPSDSALSTASGVNLGTATTQQAPDATGGCSFGEGSLDNIRGTIAYLANVPLNGPGGSVTPSHLLPMLGPGAGVSPFEQPVGGGTDYICTLEAPTAPNGSLSIRLEQNQPGTDTTVLCTDAVKILSAVATQS